MTARLPLPEKMRGIRAGIHESRPQKDTEREYALIRDAFRRLVFNWENSARRADIIEDMLALRASFLIDRALTGFRMDLDKALELLRNHNDFISERECSQRDILVAAVDNLIDFAAAEEFTMLEELPKTPEVQDMDEYEEVCERYNLTYAGKENDQVLLAAQMAAWWLTVDNGTVLMYMTQGDERVRPWHLSLEGISYPKSEFPPELIPPLEWGCRCYLVADGFASVRGSIMTEDFRERADPVFRESLATGGRIFSPAHRYFSKELPDYMTDMVQRLKTKFAYAKNNA